MFCLLSVIFPSPALKPYTNTDNPTLTLIPLFAILIVTQTDTCKIDQLGKQGVSITFLSTGVLVLANLNQTMPTQAQAPDQGNKVLEPPQRGEIDAHIQHGEDVLLVLSPGQVSNERHFRQNQKK